MVFCFQRMPMSLYRDTLFVISLVLSAFVSMPNFLAAISKFCTNFVSSSFSTLIPSMPLAKTVVCDITTHIADGAVIVI